jgi:hypothetical protein
LIKTQEGTSVTEYQLLRLYRKGNRREFRAWTGGIIHAKGGAERTAILFRPEKIGTRVWRIRLSGFQGGEYGFLPPGVAASSIAASGKIYAFGITGEDRDQSSLADRTDSHDQQRQATDELPATKNALTLRHLLTKESDLTCVTGGSIKIRRIGKRSLVVTFGRPSAMQMERETLLTNS